MRILAGTGRPAGPGGSAPASSGGRVIGAGSGFLLIAVGAILSLATPARALPAVNLHVVGIILMVVGLLRLLLLPGLRGSAQARGLRRWVNPSGTDDPRVHNDQAAAAIDVANIREGERPVSATALRSQDDEL